VSGTALHNFNLVVALPTLFNETIGENSDYKEQVDHRFKATSCNAISNGFLFTAALQIMRILLYKRIPQVFLGLPLSVSLDLHQSYFHK